MKYRWRGNLLEAPIALDEQTLTTIDDVKFSISNHTGIPCNRMKLLGLRTKSGSPINDETNLSDCIIPSQGITVLGTPATEQLAEENDEDAAAQKIAPDYKNANEKIEFAWHLWANKHVQRRFKRLNKDLTLTWLRPAERGKKLLVLDLDYTIFDCKNLREVDQVVSTRIRPYLKYMFDILSPHYNYVIWSQTKWQWVDFKCLEIGMYSSAETLPCFTLDKSSMFIVPSELNREVKCLQLIWDHCDGVWDETSTIHVDDLSRNFLLNPLNGLKISPYRMSNYDSDRELLRLSKYLLFVAGLSDVRTLDHSCWRDHHTATL